MLHGYDRRIPVANMESAQRHPGRTVPVVRHHVWAQRVMHVVAPHATAYVAWGAVQARASVPGRPPDGAPSARAGAPRPRRSAPPVGCGTRACWARCLVGASVCPGPGVLPWARCSALGQVFFPGPGVLPWARCSSLGQVFCPGPGVLPWARCPSCAWCLHVPGACHGPGVGCVPGVCPWALRTSCYTHP